jgi:S-adenosylmethionine decarboxylase
MLAEIYNIRGWVNETNPTALKKTYHDLLGLSGFDILNFQEHHFNPIGWTCLWLLGESHFAIHTFPEENKSYIELSSCNEDYYIYFVSNLNGIEIAKEQKNEKNYG